MKHFTSIIIIAFVATFGALIRIATDMPGPDLLIEAMFSAPEVKRSISILQSTSGTTGTTTWVTALPQTTSSAVCMTPSTAISYVQQ